MNIKEPLKILINKYKDELGKVQSYHFEDDTMQGFNLGEEYALKLVIEDLEKL